MTLSLSLPPSLSFLTGTSKESDLSGDSHIMSLSEADINTHQIPTTSSLLVTDQLDGIVTHHILYNTHTYIYMYILVYMYILLVYMYILLVYMYMYILLVYMYMYILLVYMYMYIIMFLLVL